MATAQEIKELREQTSCGVMECKNALEEAKGDFSRAKEILKQRGLELAAKKGSRATTEGRVEAYMHGGNKIGVMVELNCETDFVAKSEAFVQFSKDLAMHIAALSPRYISKENIPEEELKAQANPDAYAKEVALLEQPFIKDSSNTISECITNLVGSVGENILVGRFVRYKVNEVE